MGEHPFGEGRPPWGGNSLMDSRWKKTVIRSTRFSPVLMDMIKTECRRYALILATTSGWRLRQP